MKTKFRNLGIAIFLSVATIGVDASELINKMEIEPALKLENWMTNDSFFDTKKDDTSTSTVVEIAVSNPDFSILVEAD